MILALKLLLTPLLVACVTLAGRRWGPTASGLLIGMPLMSGPISLFLAVEYGRGFAAQAVVGILVGQGSFCLFSLAYGLTAQKWSWRVSTLAGVLTFIVITVVWNRFSWSLLSACAILLGTIVLGSWRLPCNKASPEALPRPPHWDLAARMVIAPTFVLVVTTGASFLGPQLSGLMTPFPTTGLVVAIFTHHQQGIDAVSRLLRANIVGSLGFAGFFLVVGLCILQLSLLWTYALAIAVALCLSGVSYSIARTSAFSQ
jgi:hypothetical protein